MSGGTEEEVEADGTALEIVKAPAVSAMIVVVVAVASLSAAVARLTEAFAARFRRKSHASGESSAMGTM